MDESTRTRREFCAHACQAISLMTFGALTQGCGGSPTSPSNSAPALPVFNATVVNGNVTLAIDAASPLAAVGGAALVQASTGSYLVSRTSPDAFTALTAICTHEACTINGFDSPSYVCPCHGSRYTTAGNVVSGPATRSLRQFATQFSNNTLAFPA